MEETMLRWNKLPLLFLHLGAAPFGDVKGQVAWSSHRSLEPVRFVFGGRRSTLLRATNMSAVVVVFVVLQLGMWMMAGDDIPLLRLRRMKLAVLGSGDHGKDPWPTCHKVSISLLATGRFIGSQSILICDDDLPHLGMVVVHIFFFMLP
jgi:hypothetical protein